MVEKAEKITVEKQALIQAVLELERQEEIKTSIILECLTQLGTVMNRLEKVFTDDRSAQAKTALLRLFISDSSWRLILTDEQIETWKSEVNNHFNNSSE